jgi:REP element-mobilizing transposase RayT
MQQAHKRKSIRLKEYNYSQPGEYFVTICTQGHEYTFGKIIDGEMQLSKVGKVVKECWEKIPAHFKNAELDSYIIMPNHLHGIIIICECNSRGEVTSPLHMPMLGQIIAYFKYQSTKLVNEMYGTPGKKCWQRNYYDRIIRNEKELNTIRDYIANNIVTWVPDKENPEEVPIFLKS